VRNKIGFKIDKTITFLAFQYLPVTASFAIFQKFGVYCKLSYTKSFKLMYWWN